MMSRKKLLLALALLTFVGLCVVVMPGEDSDVGGDATDATDASAVEAEPAEWGTVASWEGSGIKETESFAIASSEWRVQWEASDEVSEGAGILQIMVYDSDGSLVSMAANRQGTGSDVSYVRADPGRYYLMINSANVDWSITVEAPGG